MHTSLSLEKKKTDLCDLNKQEYNMFSKSKSKSIYLLLHLQLKLDGLLQHELNILIFHNGNKRVDLIAIHKISHDTNIPTINSNSAYEIY